MMMTRQWKVTILAGMSLFAATGIAKAIFRMTRTPPTTATITTTSRYTQHLSSLSIPESNLTILPGDLPGYTGWPRPQTTLASYFHIDRFTCGNDVLATAECRTGEPWSVRIRCRGHDSCQNGGSLFFVRAYGRTVLPGRVTDHGNGTYDVELPLLHDAGYYTVEVVLTFSESISIWDMPVTVDLEFAYEGYLLPRFPMTLAVVAATQSSPRQSALEVNMNNLAASIYKKKKKREKKQPIALCTSQDILIHSASVARTKSSADATGYDRTVLERGRWVVQDKNMLHPYESHATAARRADLDGYQRSIHSTGILLDYVYTDCKLIPSIDQQAPFLEPSSSQQQNKKREKPQWVQPVDYVRLLQEAWSHSKLDPSKTLRVVFIGDSNMELQRDYFHHFFRDMVQVTFLRTHDGLLLRLPEIEQSLRDMAARDEYYFVLFNAGLHDLDKYCAQNFRDFRADYLNATHQTEHEFSCALMYQERITKLVHAVEEFPALVKVWQSTTAGWPKWGNYGVAWPAYKDQPLPSSTEYVHMYNNLALQVLAQQFLRSKDESSTTVIQGIMDAFWLTLARPDHRQIDHENSLSKKLVHAGHEVYSVLQRQWAMLLLEGVRNGKPTTAYSNNTNVI